MQNSRKEVYALIDKERDYQDSVWNCDTSHSCGKHSPEEWFMYMEHYIGKAKAILCTQSQEDAYLDSMDIMRKIVSMGVCAMEQHTTPERKIK